jgi:predicted aldo/keto reductase-like oxidoreductase
MMKTAHPEWSITAWPFLWLKRLPGIQTILSGMSTLGQITENVSLFSGDTSLDDEGEKVLFNACNVFRTDVQVPCTCCHYCSTACPARIDIAAMLAIYNRYKIDGLLALLDIVKMESKGKPDDCTQCGLCNERCPQSIDIKGIMGEIVDLTPYKAPVFQMNTPFRRRGKRF